MVQGAQRQQECAPVAWRCPVAVPPSFSEMDLGFQSRAVARGPWLVLGEDS